MRNAGALQLIDQAPGAGIAQAQAALQQRHRGLLHLHHQLRRLAEKLVARLGVTLDPEGKFYRGIGALLLIVGVLVLTGWMRNIETWFVERGFDATFIELQLLGANESEKPASTGNTFMSAEMKADLYQKAPELAGIEGYINTDGKPITLSELVGKKVILIDFWTYSCINCQRTFKNL